MDALTRSAAAETLIADLERSDDSAHISGRAADLRAWSRTAAPTDVAAAMVDRWSDVTDRHWNTLLHLARLCRWFRENPATPAVLDHSIGCEMTLATARAEMPRQLSAMIVARERLAFWLAQQAQHQPARAVIPAAANDANPSSRESAA